jgi:hypothetical protein
VQGLTPEDDVAEHVHEAAIAVPDKARVHPLTHTLDHLIVCVESVSTNQKVISSSHWPG